MRGWLSAKKRDVHVLLVDRGWARGRPTGPEGVAALGHRAYVGREWRRAGQQVFDFLLARGLGPRDVVCDIGCGALRTGVHLIPFLDRGHYLGLDAVEALVHRGLELELGRGVAESKAPDLVISDRFEFDRFSRRPTVAIAISLFTHLNAADCLACLRSLHAWTGGRCTFYASFFEVPRPARNYRTSHAHLGFHYTRREMEEMGRAAGWRPEYLGEWGDRVGHQMMMGYEGP